ncbi:fused response regulator/phosphatase [Acetoanaerobium noterae]|jgi:sigma-B regulation protein RsbU (phosphoserine phosphatase)|uniref:fused response regulator/phosphatase n=1 Tax=Acetoanaerobium noterae TaxID=745369 RepID=UPI001B4DC076|nr:fused response regulator/phosphatase [Acetoanaerobium noterae]MBP8762581.1 fused response regulator/phosphatase [Acetoanaerobium sp.]MBP9499569.1 fused response regulator/phosphatase [Acetoanaerobium sp.]
MYTILVVDDTLFNRKLMLEVLETKIDNARYLQAEDGIEAIEIVKTNEVDLVILDLMMPNKNGYEVLKELKNNPLYSDIPIIVNSSVTDMDSIKQTLEMGAVDYFTKPLTPEQMEVIIPLKVNNTLKYHEQNRQLKMVSRNINNEMKMAGAFQKALMSMYEDKLYPGLDLYVYFKACEHLSGDFFELVETGGNRWFIIADIKGHGAAAAMMSFMVRKMFNNIIRQESQPKDVLEKINKAYHELKIDTELVFFSAFIGKINGNELTYSNAGHPHPALLSLDINKGRRLDCNGHFIGFMDDTTYTEETVVLEDEDCILLHTDGLYQGKQTPSVNLNRALANMIYSYSKNPSVKDLTCTVYGEYIMPDEELQDDITIVALKYKNK